MPTIRSIESGRFTKRQEARDTPQDGIASLLRMHVHEIHAYVHLIGMYFTGVHLVDVHFIGVHLLQARYL
jgi:hypothetical protein